MAKAGRSKGSGKKEEFGVRYCGLFKCKKRKWTHICCADCRETDCEAKCLNTPIKCGQVQRVG